MLCVRPFQPKMKRLLLTTVFADLAGSLTAGLTLPFFGDFSAFPVVLIMTFLNIFIPTFLAVIIYQVVKSVYYINLKRTVILHSATMITISILGLLIWNLIDTINFFGLKGVTFTSLKNYFNYQFLGYFPATLIVALTIPVIQIFLTEKLFPRQD